jgi:hypothetical protein
MNFNALLTADGRRAAALLFLLGGGMAMTVYAAWALYLVRDRADFAFYLGIAAHVSILVVLTGFAGLLVKRMLKASVAGSSFEASDQTDPTPVVTTTTTTAVKTDGAE